MFVSNVYAQSPAEILEKGKIIDIDKRNVDNYIVYHVAYKNWVYNCTVSLKSAGCYRVEYSNINTQKE